MSVHWTIERVIGDRTSEADNEHGAVQIFSCKSYANRMSKKEGGTESEKLRKAVDIGFRRYQRSTLPGNAEWVGPCGVHISDVDSSLNVFVHGKSAEGDGQRVSGRKRAHVNYRE